MLIYKAIPNELAILELLILKKLVLLQKSVDLEKYELLQEWGILRKITTKQMLNSLLILDSHY